MTFQAFLNLILACLFGFGFLIVAILLIALFVIMYIVLLLINKINESFQYKVMLKSVDYIDKIKFFSKSEMKNLEKDYVLYDNNIVDVREFIHHHPGGKIQIQESLRNDITRYINGSVAINKNFSPHKHSYLALRHIMQKLTIGIFQENHNLILDQNQRYYCYLKKDHAISIKNVR